MGEGVAHETYPYPNPQPGATRRFGGTVSHHPRGAAENARADGPAGRRAAHGRAAEIAKVVRASEETVRRWLKRYLAEGIEGLRDEPHPGAPRKVTEEYRELLVAAVRRRPRSLGLAFSLWTLRRLADHMAERTGIRVEYETVRVHLKAQGIVLSRPQHTTIASPDPEYALKKRRSKKPATLSNREITSTTPTSST